MGPDKNQTPGTL